MEEFFEKYSYIAFLVVFIAEYIIAHSPLESNSAIDIVLSVVKFIFGLDKKGDPSKKEEPKE